MFVSVIIAAAGNSTRYGTGKSKQFLILDNTPVLIKSIQAFEEIDDVKEIIITARKQDFEIIKNFIAQYGVRKVKHIVEGGATRQDSIYAAVEKVDEKADLVAVHDGARPLIKKEVIESVIQKADDVDAAACAVPVKDTIKIIDPSGKIVTTPERDALRAVQTPQIFRFSLYKEAIEKAVLDGKQYTDDCQLVESMGYPVYLVDGDYENIKITTPDDLLVAEKFLSERRK